MAEFLHERRDFDQLLAVVANDRGLDTMLVVAAAHLSHTSGRRVRIDYAKGWTPGALSAI